MDFVFKPITKQELDTYITEAHVFNVTEEEFVNHKIVLNAVDDEKFGASKQVFDIAINTFDTWQLLNVKELDGYTEIPMTSVLADFITMSGKCSVKKAMVIIRTMSNLVFDKSQGSVSVSIFNVVDNKYKPILQDVVAMGAFAKYGIYLDGTELEQIDAIKDGYIEDLDKETMRKALSKYLLQ